jgi:hypothetical protein
LLKPQPTTGLSACSSAGFFVKKKTKEKKRREKRKEKREKRKKVSSTTSNLAFVSHIETPYLYIPLSSRFIRYTKQK